MSAGLLAMAARRSEGGWDGAAGAVAQAQELDRRARSLADLDAEVYLEALEAMRSPEGARPEQRDHAIAQALARAADVPLRIAEAGADAAALAATLGELGDQAHRGDAAAAAALAAGATRAAANLVAVNLGATEDDPRVRRARTYAGDAEAAARRVVDLPVA